MKTMKKIIILILVIQVSLVACKKERPELEPAGSNVEGIQDDWTLAKVVQFDEITLKELDVSSVYIGTDPMKINFKINGTDTSYSVIKGSSINYLGSTGTWSFDDNDYPTKLILNIAGNDNYMPLLRTVRPTSQSLEFKFTKICSGKKVVSYKYSFKRS